MKKNFYYLFAMMMAVVLCVGFTSCGSDDDEGGSGNSNPLVGTWQQVSDEIYNGDDVHVSYPSNTYKHFNADGTGFLYSKGDDWYVFRFSYKKEGNVYLYMLYDDGTPVPEYFKVISCTETELVIGWLSENWKETDDNDSKLIAIGKYVKVSDSVIAGIK